MDRKAPRIFNKLSKRLKGTISKGRCIRTQQRKPHIPTDNPIFVCENMQGEDNVLTERGLYMANSLLPESDSSLKSDKSQEKPLLLDSFLDVVSCAAKQLEEKDNKIISIMARDNTPLIGHWIPQKEAKRIIIAMHGWRSSWSKDFGLVSEFWEKNQCSVLYVEQRGQNNSGGDYMGFGLIERYDCLEWIRWVENNNPKNLGIYLCGISMGASTVLMASGLKLPWNVYGIIADCGFTSPYAIWKYVLRHNLHISYGVRSSLVDAICRRKIKMGTKDCSTVDALKNCDVPILLIHGTEDRFVPIEMSYQNYCACKAYKRIVVVPGANHGMSYYMDKELYESEVLHFWQKTNKKGL